MPNVQLFFQERLEFVNVCQNLDFFRLAETICTPSANGDLKAALVDVI